MLSTLHITQSALRGGWQKHAKIHSSCLQKMSKTTHLPWAGLLHGPCQSSAGKGALLPRKGTLMPFANPTAARSFYFFLLVWTVAIALKNEAIPRRMPLCLHPYQLLRCYLSGFTAICSVGVEILLYRKGREWCFVFVLFSLSLSRLQVECDSQSQRRKFPLVHCLLLRTACCHTSISCNIRSHRYPVCDHFIFPVIP